MPINVLKLLDDHGHELHALLVRLTLRHDVADDLLQELFLRLRDLSAAQVIDHPPAFARQVAIHLAFDWRRSMARQRRLLEATQATQLADAPPWIGAAQQEEAERILSITAELGVLPQQAFVLRYVASESYQQIGAALGRTPHQARGICHQAVREIRDRMQQRGWLDAKPPQKAGMR